MAHAAITSDCLKALQVTLNFAPKITFDQQSTGVYCMHDLPELLGCQAFSADVRIDVRLLKDLFSRPRADAVNVRQRSFDAFISRYINSK